MTIERILLIIIGICFLIILLLKALYGIVARKVGDCAVEWVEGYLKIDEIKYKSEWEAWIKCALPIKSSGKQQCIIIDMIGRLQPEGDKLLAAENHVYTYAGGGKRADGYWEAVLIKPGDTLILNNEITLRCADEPIKKVIARYKYINLDLYYKYYCRNTLKYTRKTIRLNLDQVPGFPEDPDAQELFTTKDKGQKVLPIRTPLLGISNNIYQVFNDYAKPHVREGDIMAICESALAIMEGRVYYVEDIQPGFLATHINKLFKMDSSLSSPYSLEMGIREVGAPRIVLSVILGALGRVAGRAGDFYAFAGRAVATIDDCTGTLPPFDKYVVMGPKDPIKSAREFKEKTGVDLAVVDVNNLGKVDVLGLSDMSKKDLVVEMLKPNPQGNANEQTPIALIRKPD